MQRLHSSALFLRAVVCIKLNFTYSIPLRFLDRVWHSKVRNEIARIDKTNQRMADLVCICVFCWKTTIGKKGRYDFIKHSYSSGFFIMRIAFFYSFGINRHLHFFSTLKMLTKLIWMTCSRVKSFALLMSLLLFEVFVAVPHFHCTADFSSISALQLVLLQHRYVIDQLSAIFWESMYPSAP